VIRRLPGRLPILGTFLTLSGAYLVALLFGYVFGVGAVRRHHVESASYIFAAVWLLATLARGQPSALQPTLYASNAPPVALVAAAALLYGNTVFLGLFSDDFVLVARALRGDWWPQAEFVRPIPLAIWRVLLTSTSNPAAFHVLSIILHGLNAALVYALALRFGLGRSGALAAGALFVAFPSSVEAVVWPAAVHDLIVAACALGFVLIAGQRRSGLGIVAGMLVLLAGLLSKESALAIPVVAAVIWLRRRSFKDADGWPVLLAGVGVCVFYGVVRTALVTIPDSFAQSPTRYMLKELIARPIATLMLPWTTAIHDSWPAIPFLWVLGCVVAAAMYASTSRRALPPHVILRCLIAVFVAVLPVYSMLFVTPDLENGRYLYLSTAFWVVALIALASTPDGLTRGRVLLLGAAIVAGAVGVQMHLTPWREAARIRERVLTAAQSALKNAPCSPISFAGAPDSVRGAYVFRNGLSEAIAFRTGAVGVPARGGCEFVWNGSAFQRAGTPSGTVQASFAR
jgi:hypothetical protein